MTTQHIELNETHFDALREIGNIGAGNAATSLGVMLNEGVSISVPEINFRDYNDAVGIIGKPEDMCVAVLVNFGGDMSGLLLFIMSLDDAKSITDILVAGEGDDNDNDNDNEYLSEMKISSIKELGNILASSYMGSIAELTKMEITLSIPFVAIDMVGAVFAVPLAEYSATDNKVMLIEESFNTHDRCLRSHAILFTKIEMLTELMSRLGFVP